MPEEASPVSSSRLLCGWPECSGGESSVRVPGSEATRPFVHPEIPREHFVSQGCPFCTQLLPGFKIKTNLAVVL